MTKKILFIGFYELKESLLAAANALSSPPFYYSISHFPLFQYAYDRYDKCPDYLNKLVQKMEEVAPDVVIWWFIGIPESEIRVIMQQNRSIHHILYNPNDPYCWSNAEFIQKVANFNLVISPCNVYTSQYKDHLYSPPPFSPMFHHPPTLLPKTNTDYDCDISFCITNLYPHANYPNQYINRREIIDKLVQMTDIKFHLYGPQFLKDIYPTVYKGYVQFADTCRVFHRSRINLSTHVEKNTINERTITILASRGGVLLSDLPIIGEAGEFIGFTLHSINELETTVRKILQMTDGEIDAIRHNGYEWVQKYSWDLLAKKIHFHIAKVFFNTELYKELYCGNGFADWQNYYAERLFDYPSIIPDGFNYTRYNEDHAICEYKEDSVKYRALIAYKWLVNGADPSYIIVKKNSMGNGKGKIKVKGPKKADIPLSDEDHIAIAYHLGQLKKRDTKIGAHLQAIHDIFIASPYLTFNADDYVSQ
jgi:hypothetical protein